MNPDQIEKLIITDHRPVDMSVWIVCEEPLLGNLSDWDEPLCRKCLYFTVPQNTILISTKEGALGMLHITGSFEWLLHGAVHTQAMAYYMDAHQRTRDIQLKEAFESAKVDPLLQQDFVLEFKSDTAAFPTIASIIRMPWHGRPPFSLDRTQRVTRSPPLSEEEEIQGIFALLVILKTVHHLLPVDQWSVNAQVAHYFCLWHR